MAPYNPKSRRPIADMFRRTAKWAVDFCVRFGVDPDTVSFMSIVASATAAVLLWQSAKHPWFLLLAPGFCYLRLWFNMLDGMVALASGKASLKGEIMNEVPDRISDVIIFVGIAHSGLCSQALGYWAAIFALFTAYIGTFGQAVGVQREFSGIMSKPWRMVMVHIGAWTAFFVHCKWGGLTVLDWACVVVIAGCVQTVVVRLSRILAELGRKKA